MTNKNARGNKCPSIDSSTDAARTSERDHSGDDESAGESKGQAGDGTPPANSLAPGLEYSEGSARAQVATWLVENIEEPQYLKSRDIAPDLDLNEQQVGSALGMIVDDDLPVDIQRWSASKGRVTWYIEPAEETVMTDGGTVSSADLRASEADTQTVVDHLKDLDDVTISTAKRLAPNIDGIDSKTVGKVLRYLADADEAPVSVSQWDNGTSGGAVWHIDPPDCDTATDGGPYTIPTGDGYVGTYRVHEEIRLTSSDLRRIGVEKGDEVSAVPSREGVRVVPGESADAIQVSPAKKAKGRMLQAEFYKPVLNALGVVDGEDVRIYDVGENALEIVPADGDPHVDEELVTDGGFDPGTLLREIRALAGLVDDQLDRHADRETKACVNRISTTADSALARYEGPSALAGGSNGGDA